MIISMENIGGGMAAPSKSAVGPIVLGRWLDIKDSPKNLCSHVIFIVFFKFQIEIAGGDGINQFLLKI